MLVCPRTEKFKLVTFSIKRIGFSETKRMEMNYISTPFSFFEMING